MGTPPIGCQWYYNGNSLGTSASGTNFTVFNAQMVGDSYTVPSQVLTSNRFHRLQE